ncbi:MULTISPECIES: TfpX/TfpZ family type IV pilin accessory protein [Psychrobacter]|uniref:TfpX/TfpZ family type IV pilin accessory protein n=1 Tax=Psychrobacter TaxID=497 RepID=UPI0018CFC5E1|nr:MULTISPECIES: TfpX/TfpZ family type IV pilin accessory protein [Psychrobacter]MBH0063950.1 type IV pilin accessory protein [Psychrobacter sp. SZ93C1]
MLIYKLKAFGWHLVASLMIAAVSLVIVLCVWYPQPLYQATGVIKIFLIMLGIDIILGPLLTFIVYKPNKKTLKFDLTVIVLLQLAAFSYGFYHVYDGRPVWIAYNVDRFDLVKNNEIDTRKIAEALPEYRQVSHWKPKYVAAIIPAGDIEASNEILFDEVGLGVAPSQRPELYQPLGAVDNIIVTRAKLIDELYNYNTEGQVDKILSQYPTADGYLPLKASASNMVVLIDKKEGGKIVDIVDLRPW